ncbi:amino acid adenylation domain-containing protein [Halalkalibacterium halodurans]|nr:amino acid adenylation domain-containing protein [Halalkalibacterium halodurans]
MLFHTLHQPESGLYVEQLSFQMIGKVEQAMFEKAWQETIQMHSALRTTFHWKESDRILQVVHKQIDIRVNYIDIRHHSIDEGKNIESIIEEIAGKLKREGFDLSKGPLMKLHLLRIGDNEYHFIWTFHHLLLDGWSMGRVMQDILKLYEGYVQKNPVFIPAPEQYESYISWLNNQDMDGAKQFWLNKLEGFENICPFSAGDSFSKRKTQQDGYQDLWLSETVKEQLVNLTHEHEITIFSLLQTAWILLINGKYNIEDIVIGNVVSGRPHDLKGAENIVGPFINTLPLRAKVKANDRILTLIKQVQQEQLEISSYAFTPLKDIHKVCNLQGNQSLFDSIVVFENYPLDQSMFSNEALGFRINNFSIEEKSNFPLSLAIIPYDNQVILRLHYDSEVMTSEQTNKILEQVENIVQEIILDITRTVDSISLLSPEDRDKSIMQSETTECIGVTESAPQVSNVLHQRFEHQAARRPDKIALRTESDLLSYEQLNCKAEHIASLLLSKGLKFEERVAVLLNRSLESIVSMLGILKAGGVYVPLDVNLPPERLEYVIQDANIRTMITEEPFTEKYKDQVLDLINIHHSSKTQHLEAIDRPPVVADQLAYIMYTSGSTGLPKGVAVTHEAAALHYTAFQQQFQLSEDDVVLQFSAMTFDPSIEQVFPTLFSGGEVFVRGEDVWDAQHFVHTLEEYAITVANLPTAYFYEVVNSLMITTQCLSLPALRFLAIGGDKLSYKHVQLWNRLNQGKTQLFNFYGPTETVTTSTFYLVQPSNLLDEISTIPIGIPMSGRKLYILDTYGRPVPSGEKGELCIGGNIIARGYVNKPRLTAQRFIPDPFSTEEGALMYRTGDIVRLNEHGDLEYIGRNDDQVKIRGYRIEIGEIEKALLTIREVEDVAVIVHDQDTRSKTLVAYVVVAGDMDRQRIKRKLKDKLPEYMLPKQIMFLDRLPLNTNGKVDRKSLPLVHLQDEEYKENDENAAPKTETEKALVNIWKSVLQVQQVSIKDNFFDLGGDSILALQIVAKAQEIGIRVSTKDVFEYQTIEELASSVLTGAYPEVAATTIQKHVVGSDRGKSGENIPLTPIQSWFFEQQFDQHHHWNQSVLLQVKERINTHALTEALEAVVDHHEALKYRYHQKDGQWIQQVTDRGKTYAIDVIKLNDNSTTRQIQVKEEILRVQTSLNIENGPIMKVLYLEHTNTSLCRLFITIHHLVVDSVSWRILLEDLLRLYRQALQSKQLDIPERTSSFKDWSYTLSTYAQQHISHDEQEYWEKKASIEYKLPVDFRNDSNNTEGSLDKITLTFTREETESLTRTLHTTLGAKAHEILIAALMISLQQWSDTRQIKIDIEGHGRENIDPTINLSKTVGWFTTLFPVTVNFDQQYSVLQKVQRAVQELRSIPMNGIGYGLLKYMSGSILNERPADVSFNYLGHIHTELHTDAPFMMSSESIEPLRHAEAKRTYLLDIEGGIFDGQLKLDWMFSKNVHQKSTMINLTNEFNQVIKECVSIGQQLKGYKHLPKDFPTAVLSLEDWKIVNELEGNIEDLYSLSPIQEGMLFHSLLQPGTGVYVQQMAFKIKGEAFIERFMQSWEYVMNQHPILRTIFRWEGFEKPVQIVKAKASVHVDILDWTDRRFSSDFKVQDELGKLCKKLRESTVDISKDKLVCFTFVKLESNEFFFIWNYHHMLLDGWSMPTVLSQVCEVYTKLLHQEPLPKLESPPFRVFIDWYLKQDHSTAETFWKTMLDGYQHTTYLPIKQVDPVGGRRIEEISGQTHEEMTLQLSSASFRRLKQLATKKRVTLYSLIQTAWSILLHYASKKEDLIFGSVYSGRPASIKGIEDMVGMFINTLPIRVKIEADQTLNNLLQNAHALQMKVKEYEHTPLVDIKKWSGIQTRGELFDTCVIYANFPNVMSTEGTQQIIEGVEVSDITALEQTNYPLTLSVVTNETMSLDVNFDTYKIDKGDVEHYLFILEHILNNFENRIESTLTDISKELDKLFQSRSGVIRSKQREKNRSRLLNVTRRKKR